MAEAKWKKLDDIWCAKIADNDYEVYENPPGIYLVRRNTILIAETFTADEGKRWAEAYDAWFIQESHRLFDPPKRMSIVPHDLLEATKDTRHKMFKKDYIINMNDYEPQDDWIQFPRNPTDMLFSQRWIAHLNR